MLYNDVYLLPGNRRVEISQSGPLGAEQKHNLLSITLTLKRSQQSQYTTHTDASATWRTSQGSDHRS